MWRERYGYRYVMEAGAPEQPALVLLHGTGDDARSFLELGRRVAPGAMLLSIAGNVDENGMARFFRRKAMGVYDMEDLKARTDAFAVFLANALKEHGITDAIGIGYSNGANLLANLLFEHPSVVRRLALLHPLIPFEPPLTPLEGAELLVTAGERDPIAPAPTTNALVAALRARGASVDVLMHPGGHELTAVELEAVKSFVSKT